jgi:hypothetical protein
LYVKSWKRNEDFGVAAATPKSLLRYTPSSGLSEERIHGDQSESKTK